MDIFVIFHTQKFQNLSIFATFGLNLGLNNLKFGQEGVGLLE